MCYNEPIPNKRGYYNEQYYRFTKPVAEVVKEHPEIKAILVDLGFKPLAQVTMLNTVGKVTSLKAGAKLANVSLDKIQKVLEFNGYEVIGGNND